MAKYFPNEGTYLGLIDYLSILEERRTSACEFAQQGEFGLAVRVFRECCDQVPGVPGAHRSHIEALEELLDAMELHFTRSFDREVEEFSADMQTVYDANNNDKDLFDGLLEEHFRIVKLMLQKRSNVTQFTVAMETFRKNPTVDLVYWLEIFEKLFDQIIVDEND